MIQYIVTYITMDIVLWKHIFKVFQKILKKYFLNTTYIVIFFSRLKYVTNHWCVTRREKTKHKYHIHVWAYNLVSCYSECNIILLRLDGISFTKRDIFYDCMIDSSSCSFLSAVATIIEERKFSNSVLKASPSSLMLLFIAAILPIRDAEREAT